ncbi:MAG: tetratricopeptide repeat protein [bacterium]|nr:tetratricopeptide repeat protein [bacterium]
MNRTRSWLLVAALGVLACAAAPEIPRPDLTGAEQEVVAAVETAQRRVTQEPQSPEAWGELGERYRAQQWNLQAVECYARAESLDSAAFLWPYLIGKLLRHDDPLRADEAFGRAAAIDASYAPLLVFHARVLARLGRTGDARARFEAARRADPGLAAPLIGLGQIELSSDRLDAAAALFTQAIERDPGDGRAHHGLAQIALARGDADGAELHATLARRHARPRPLADPRAINRAEPAGSWGWTQHGRRLLAARRIDEAVAALERAVAINPRRQTARLGLGLALVLQGRAADAEPHLRQAALLDPGDAQARAALGNLLGGLGPAHAEQARGELQAAVRLDPERTDAHHALARLAMARGDRAAARNHLARAVETARAAGRTDVARSLEQQLGELNGGGAR